METNAAAFHRTLFVFTTPEVRAARGDLRQVAPWRSISWVGMLTEKRGQEGGVA